MSYHSSTVPIFPSQYERKVAETIGFMSGHRANMVSTRGIALGSEGDYMSGYFSGVREQKFQDGLRLRAQQGLEFKLRMDEIKVQQDQERLRLKPILR